MHVALLRGVNVGGKSSLPMKQLVALFLEAGCSDVRTYIQSGNVVFNATGARAKRLPALISSAIADRLGLRAPVIVRTAEELQAVASANPWLRAGMDSKALHVVFLAERPSAAQVAALDPKRSPPDEFRVKGREIYLCCPNGIARTRLSNAYFDSVLGTVSTMRNWRTVLKLCEMIAE